MNPGPNGKRRSPESERYDELKGRAVVVVFGESDAAYKTANGTLRWVDRYTLGVQVDGPYWGGRSQQVWIINKAKVVMIGEA